MTDKTSIEEQVAQLSQEQQDKILKIGKIVTIVGSVIFTLMLLWVLAGVYLVFDPPIGVEIDYVKHGLGIIVGGCIGFALIIATLVFVKVKFPFYSDKKLSYIKKLRRK